MASQLGYKCAVLVASSDLGLGVQNAYCHNFKIAQESMPRKYSDKFVENKIAKINEMFERNQCIVDCPKSFSASNESVFIGQTEKEKIKNYLKQNRERSYVQGFWAGWTLREGTKD